MAKLKEETNELEYAKIKFPNIVEKNKVEYAPDEDYREIESPTKTEREEYKETKEPTILWAERKIILSSNKYIGLMLKYSSLQETQETLRANELGCQKIIKSSEEKVKQAELKLEKYILKNKPIKYKKIFKILFVTELIFCFILAILAILFKNLTFNVNLTILSFLLLFLLTSISWVLADSERIYESKEIND